MQREREHFDSRAWWLTVGLLIAFPPVGLAALLRWVFKQRVWG